MASHYEDERLGIERRLEANWIQSGTPSAQLTPIKYWSANRPLNEVNGARYISLQISRDEGEQISLGPPPQWVRYTGLVIVQIFVPEDEGNTADALAAVLDSIFMRAQFSYGTSGVMTFRVPRATPVGISNAYFQTNWTCVFERNKLH